MRRKTFIQRLLTISTLLAFLALSFIAVMPHTHPGMMGPQPHDCSICRAQATEAVVEQFQLLESSPLFVCGVTAPLSWQFIVQSFKNVSSSRAPPFSA